MPDGIIIDKHYFTKMNWPCWPTHDDRRAIRYLTPTFPLQFPGYFKLILNRVPLGKRNRNLREKERKIDREIDREREMNNRKKRRMTNVHHVLYKSWCFTRYILWQIKCKCVNRGYHCASSNKCFNRSHSSATK